MGNKDKKNKSHKSEKKKHRRRDASSTDDSSPERTKSSKSKNKPKTFDFEREKLEKKRQKELMKALETPEEKRARRIAKKELKERKRRENMGWDKEYMGYTNTDNPFGDHQLLDTFVWHKKLEKQGLQDLADGEKKKLMHSKQESNKRELAKVKKQRLERERDRQLRDEEMELMQREREAEHFKAWEDQEDKFHLEQAKLRSKIRIQDSRAKPIDLLAKYASSAEQGAEDMSGVEMHEPYTYLNGLTLVDLEDLIEDIKIYMELEQDKNSDFWRDMTVVTEDELLTLKKIAAKEDGLSTRNTMREGVNKAVSSDVSSIFRSKSYDQLLKMQEMIKEKLESGESSLDVGYWESLLSQIKAYLAKARLRDRHQKLLKSKLEKLKMELVKNQDEVQEQEEKKEDKPSTSAGINEAEDLDENEEPEVMGEQDWEKRCIDEYNEGPYSPKLVQIKNLPPDAVIVGAEEDWLTIEGKRKLLHKTGDSGAHNEDAFVKKAKEGMDAQEECSFSVEAPVAQQVFLWADKYRPRKPRFFNRVHTGFEWNKYNQTHYDFDSPPPKVVQGYKFNIFYPDLIARDVPPTYTITPDPQSADFAVLKFTAGPPYQDIAFKIVNREWEYSHKHGFRCQFINSIFQLWFHFKRYRYRR